MYTITADVQWGPITKTDLKLIYKIVDRAKALAIKNGQEFNLLTRARFTRDMVMDLNAVHCNGCKLRLAELLAASDFNFIHDVYGIKRHINRITGKVEGHFTPRYATK